MLELIKTVVELLKGGIDGLAKSAELRDARRRRDLGTELAIFYLELCRVIASARDIVSSLEWYVSRMTRHLSHGDDAHALTGGSWISLRVQLQRANVARLTMSAQRLEAMLDLLDPDARRSLDRLLRGKRNALNALHSLLAHGRLPIAEPDLQLPNVSANLSTGAIDTGTPWDETVYTSVRHYLDVRAPGHVVEELEKVASEIREVIAKNFTLAEVLIDVHESPARRRRQVAHLVAVGDG